MAEKSEREIKKEKWEAYSDIRARRLEDIEVKLSDNLTLVNKPDLFPPDFLNAKLFLGPRMAKDAWRYEKGPDADLDEEPSVPDPHISFRTSKYHITNAAVFDYGTNLHEIPEKRWETVIGALVNKAKNIGYRGVSIDLEEALIADKDADIKEARLDLLFKLSLLMDRISKKENTRLHISMSSDRATAADGKPFLFQTFSSANRIARDFLSEHPSNEYLKWAFHLTQRFEDLGTALRNVKRKDSGPFEESTRYETVSWTGTGFSYTKINRNRETGMEESRRGFTQSDFDFENMTMKMKSGNTEKVVPMKLKQLAYMMSFGGDPEKMVREGLKKAAEKNPFMKEVLKFTEEAAMLMFCDRTMNLKLYRGSKGYRGKFHGGSDALSPENGIFIPYMEAKTLMDTHNWGEFFHKQYPEAEKAGCNFNKMTPWQSIALLLSSRIVRPEDLNILYNDGSAILRANRDDTRFILPDKILTAVAVARCKEDKGDGISLKHLLEDSLYATRTLEAKRLDPDKSERAAKIVGDKPWRFPLIPKSAKRWQEIHDELHRKTKALGFHETVIPENSRFLPLRQLLPPDFEWLGSTERLVEESENMNHCVGRSNNYIDRINEDTSSIWSVVRDGKRYTMEIRGTRNNYEINQLYGQNDSIDFTNRVLKREVESLMNGKVPKSHFERAKAVDDMLPGKKHYLMDEYDITFGDVAYIPEELCETVIWNSVGPEDAADKITDILESTPGKQLGKKMIPEKVLHEKIKDIFEAKWNDMPEDNGKEIKKNESQKKRSEIIKGFVCEIEGIDFLHVENDNEKNREDDSRKEQDEKSPEKKKKFLGLF